MKYFTLLLGAGALTKAHTVGWAKGMYCFGGPDPSSDDQNTNTAVNPLYDLDQADWWFQHDRGCDKVPPKDGDILELPAGGSFTVEMAHNRAFTSFSYDGQLATDWPDGKEHAEGWSAPADDCVAIDGALHTYNESTAAGTAFAISYESDMANVTMDNLVVFSVLAQ